MRTSFYNTVQAVHPDLNRYETKAKTQEDKILRLFRASFDWHSTPSHVHRILYGETNVPLTSVRRAMTNLTIKGELEKTDRQEKGLYGRNEFVWRLARGQRDLF